MTVFFIIILICALLYLYWPRILLWGIRRAARRSQAYYQSRQAGDPGARSQSRQQQPRRRRKKIDPSVGEYVDFEEVRTYTSQSQDASAADERPAQRYTAESQITDVEWEDIP